MTAPRKHTYEDLTVSPPQKRAMRHEGRPVTIFLISGIKLTGILEGPDASGLTLTRDGVGQDVFYQAIATIVPQA